MGSHDHAGLHIIWRSVEDELPKGRKNDIGFAHTSGGYGPNVAAEDFCGHVWIPSEQVSDAGEQTRRLDALESVLALYLYLASDICKKPVEDADSAKVLREPRVLSLALLEEVVLVEDGSEGRLLVDKALDGGGIVEAESTKGDSELGGSGGQMSNTSRTWQSQAKAAIYSVPLYGN